MITKERIESVLNELNLTYQTARVGYPYFGVPTAMNRALSLLRELNKKFDEFERGMLDI